MDKVIFTQLSEGEIRTMLKEELRNVLQESKPDSSIPTKEIINIREAGELTDLAKQTIYGLVNRREIPYFKQGQKLRFKRSELIHWIESGRVMTRDEISEQVDEHLASLKQQKSGRRSNG